MPEALAKTKQREFNAAKKKLGLQKPKHEPSGTITGRVSSAESNTEEVDKEGGLTSSTGVVQSGFSVFNPGIPPAIPLQGAKTMSTPDAKTDVKQKAASEKPAKQSTPVTDQVANATMSQAQIDREAAAKAKIAAKAAKIEAAQKAKEEREKATEAKRLEREAAAKLNAEQRAALKAQRDSAGKSATDAAISMSALAERVKAGLYVKSLTGQFRSTDDLAVALDAVPAENVVKMGMELFNEPNKYAGLNIGQQSMNYRNRMRGALKKADGDAGRLTMEQIKECRDRNGYATAEAEAAKKAEAKAAREKAAADKKAAAEAAKAKAEADKKAKAETKPVEAQPATA